MRAWFHSWQQKTSKMMKIVQIGVLLAVIALIVLFILGYIFNWTWTGVGPYVSPPHPQGSDFQREKTLYDWFQLAIIPVALAVGVWWLNRLQQQRDQQLAEKRAQVERDAAEKQAQTERDIALDNQQEAALKAYIDNISELILKEHLNELTPERDKVRNVACVRTLTVLPRLDGWRKRTVLLFLYESGLIHRDNSIVDLSGARLDGAGLEGADLSRADLSGTILQEANLRGARLDGADLRGAFLINAKMIKATLIGAIGFTNEELEDQAKSLKGATMPDGKKHA
jgi:Pentapeptide repeats (8 copies)